MNREQDYVLGTHDEELDRLGLQHRVWRPRVLDAWRRAGFTIGQTLLDLGCGPGYATLDLAEIVGPAGRVSAVDRSRRFLDALERTRQQRGLANIDTQAIDLDEGDLPETALDGAWCRWVLAFVKRPRRVIEQLGRRLKPGGVFVVHEYFDYSTYRVAPRCAEIEEFVAAVMEAWRADGGEPDIALELPGWLAEQGFEIRSLQPFVDIVPASSFVWHWPKSFIHIGLRRLVDLGRMNADRASAITRAFAACEAAPHTRLITPAVMEIIAVRR
ncbi:MAG: methyltransferase domain-containing protein [Phycisphaerales bacterium]|nr:methyltransferase domain-containing protein [Phycisphaerales bacterium]